MVLKTMLRSGERSRRSNGAKSSLAEHLIPILHRLEEEADPSVRATLKRSFLAEEDRCSSVADKAAAVQGFADEYGQKLERQRAITAEGSAPNHAQSDLLARIVDVELFLRSRATLLTNKLNGIL